MWQAILRFFGFGKRPGTGPSVSPKFTKKNILPSNYYRRGGKYFAVNDDSLIEDLLLLAILEEYYDEGAIVESYPEPEVGDVNNVDTSYDNGRTEPEVDILDIDVSDTPVEAAPKVDIWLPVEDTTEPETRYSASSGGSSYASGSSDYDSGSSSSGGSDD